MSIMLAAGVTLMAVGVNSDNPLALIFGGIVLGMYAGAVEGMIRNAAARH